jgi:hypothetical protein
MWICPACKHKFFNSNQSHSCGDYSVDGFLEGKSKKGIELFHYFIAEYKKIGPLELPPVKTRVALLSKMRFCSINKIGDGFIDVHLVLTKQYADNLFFYKIENLGDRFFVHHMKLYDFSDVNDEVKNYMKLAYDVGERKHIKNNNG